ncbi:hypothetical protein PF004_g2306 [Phytophthora fragariae]|uniref:Uncharacterized protein n=1 Tax=Phytophthora fragariae TaxID=53985 RepID=A0A6G0PPQ4_9STRA|nr:hypothetical protein PF004_g2306 [Phytophthora fragariae]
MVPGSLPAAAKSLLGFGSVYYVVVKNLLACSDGGAVSIWCMGMFLAITNFFLERMSGIRMMVSFGWFSTLVEVEDNEMDELSEGEHGHERLPPEQNLPMVPWYSMLLFDTVFDLLISLKDAATRSRACLPSQVDCEVPDDKSSGDESESEEGCSGKKKTKTIKRVFPRAYHPSAISTRKKTPEGCSSLRDYEGPSVFAIPGNHDWFDGLNTFTRYICQRDWLGGWLLPQKTSYFSIKLPHGWWLFGVDLALENDVDTEQFGFFERVVQSQMGPNDAVIVLTHEPRWLLDVYEDRSNLDAKLSYLIENVLKGRCAVRLAGDIHNYTRHSLVEETHTLKRPASMQFDTARSKITTANLPRTLVFITSSQALPAHEAAR